MEDTVVVAERCSLEELPHERPHHRRFERSSFSVRVHVLLQVEVHEFEDEHEFRLGVDNVVEANDVGMLELLHEGDLADGGGGRTLLGVEVDLLERYELVGDARATLGSGKTAEREVSVVSSSFELGRKARRTLCTVAYYSSSITSPRRFTKVSEVSRSAELAPNARKAHRSLSELLELNVAAEQGGQLC
jgi:hypothetical protein